LVGYNTGKALIYAHAGPARVELQFPSETASDNAIVLGLGARYALTQNVAVGIEYSKFDIEDFGEYGFSLSSDAVALRLDFRFWKHLPLHGRSFCNRQYP
jgi:opacity protein-like surface antigen